MKRHAAMLARPKLSASEKSHPAGGTQCAPKARKKICHPEAKPKDLRFD
jgi:hypothetical protein